MYARDSFCVRLMLILSCAIAFSGCDGTDRDHLPAPLVREPPFSYQGTVHQIWGGDSFEIAEGRHIHFVFLRGVDTPEYGQPCHQESIEFVASLIDDEPVTVMVVDRDPWKREICDLKLPSKSSDDQVIDPAAKLIEQGLAWYDRSDGPYADRYLQAERKARESKIGIWSEENPTPPWEYWQEKNQSLSNELKQR